MTPPQAIAAWLTADPVNRTIEVLARLIGVSIPAAQCWASGMVAPSPAHAMRLRALGLDVNAGTCLAVPPEDLARLRGLRAQYEALAKAVKS